MIEVLNFKQDFNVETKIHLKNIKFENGKVYAILGVSGCGKSTLLNAIAGIRKPTEGKILINNIDITELSQKDKDKFRLENMGYIFQDFKLMEEMTVLDNLKILKLEKVKCKTFDEVLKNVGLLNKKNEKVKNLSGGEKQRVSIARAILKTPQIILADEPTGSLNFEKSIEIMELLRKCQKNSKQILIFVTHDERLTKYADKVIHFEELLIRGGEKNAWVCIEKPSY